MSFKKMCQLLGCSSKPNKKITYIPKNESPKKRSVAQLAISPDEVTIENSSNERTFYRSW